jgi:hypothetical protein
LGLDSMVGPPLRPTFARAIIKDLLLNQLLL